MRYAIISDVHGNLHSLKAVIEDAGIHQADRYLFLGDYFLDCPYPNEVIETIRSHPEAVVITGNKDTYLLRLSEEALLKKQMAAARWNLKQITAENRAYLLSLPETLAISDQGTVIRLMHSSDIFYRFPRIQPFYSSWFREEIKKAPFSHDAYLAYAFEALMSRQDALDKIKALPRGVYLFGHNHLQFHAEYDGRIFINPGSCGTPLDCRVTASYTLLDIEGASCQVIERRVSYDINDAIKALRSSDFAAEAPEWRKITERVLRTGQDYFHLFLTHVYETARQLGDTSYPVTDTTWEKAAASWDFVKMKKRT
jgi:predicted phosphodiesterase